MSPPSFSQLKEWYRKHQQEIQKEYFTFLSFPSISTDPAYNQETRKTAEWLAAYLEKMGLDVSIWPTSGHPVLFATHLHAGPKRPTILIYHHYDVQPVDPLELWHHDPFKPLLKNNQVYARGASDNKGQCFYSINAIGAFLKLAQEANVNIKVFIEGEEESGGAGTFALLPGKKEELQADYLLIVDSDIPETGVPGVTLGTRGILAMQVECSNSSIDLHSGTHGGIALNPNRALVELLAKLWEPSGRVAVPGFYDAVLTPSPKEKALFDLTFDERYYRKTFGIRAMVREEGYTPMEANWMRPTLEINGISGGYTGKGFKTVIPSKAIAKISCRLVPDQDPDIIGKAVVDFLKSQVAKEIDLQVERYHGAAAYRSPFPSMIAKVAMEAYEETFGKPCKRLLSGGSIPIVGELAKISGAEALMMGTALPEDDIHAPNEHFGLDRFEQGFLTIGGILSRLAAI